MKRTIVFVLLFGVLWSINVYPQSTKEVYQFSSDIFPRVKSESANYQVVATDYSLSGYFKKALEIWDSIGIKRPRVSSEDSLFFNTFSAFPARDYILNRAKDEQILIINEAHHIANHRTFTTSLLLELFHQGYRYLALEALYDSLINDRKFPVSSSGYYTREPEFGNMISEALRIGYTLFGYEALHAETGEERERKQAENIENFMREHPEGKLIIHCGYDHLNEGVPGIRSWEKAMARRVKENLQIDPFTIDQTAYLERGNSQLNHPFMGSIDTDYPVILVNGDGVVYNGIKNRDKADCIVIHPATNYKNCRPQWMLNYVDRQIYQVPLSKIPQYPVLILAYRVNEWSENGIPADVIEVAEKGTVPPFILRKDTYEIVMKDKDYTVINRFTVTIQ